MTVPSRSAKAASLASRDVGTRAPASPRRRPFMAGTVQILLTRYAELPSGHPDRARLRTRSIEAGLPLARALATRYQGRGEPLDDLYQVAALALVRAIDGYDPIRGVAFASYAVPTIVGALRRHFRDTTWSVRVPRRVQEMARVLPMASAHLAQQFGRSPTQRELAAHLGAAEFDVAVGLNAWRAYRPESLDGRSTMADDDQQTLGDTVGATDPGFDEVTNRQVLVPLLAALTTRQRQILGMRYFDDLTQTEIAARIGISQMPISRLLARTLRQLRTAILGAR
jgi:RNA polymerase sigma-B factor